MTKRRGEPNVRRAAVVTVSDGVAGGVRDDASGRAVAWMLEEAGFEASRREVVPDERDQIASRLRSLAEEGVALVVTTGGTGLGPRDVTPEATRDVMEREAPGLAEAMRAAGRASTPMASLSREVAGSVGSTLIVNLPGSEKGARESLHAVIGVLPHALDLLAGDTVHGPAEAKPSGHEHGPEPQGAGRQDVGGQNAGRQDVVVATAIRVEGNPPCRVGQKMLLGPGGAVAGTLGCAEFDDAAIADAPAILASGTAQTRTYTHDLGTVEVFLEPPVRRPRLIVFSATPVARKLVRWAADLGFDPVLVEPREDRLTAEDRAAGTVAAIDGLPIDDRTMAVHTDHDAPDVAESVAALLRSPAAFIGVMGSRRHVGPHVERLRGLGFGEEDLARVRSPVGLDLGAESAEEIALSILAGLVAARREGQGGWLDRS